MLTAVTHLRATGRQALRHAQTARLVGRPEPALGAVLVEHPQPAAYCVAGRHPTVILTTGALQALDPGQLDAVLAHERAHLAGRHHRLLAMARIGRQVLPFVPLMRDADAQVARLVELHADDAATRASDPRSLATALVVLATARPAPRRPSRAAATDTVQRIHRLLDPAEPLSRVRRHLLRATAAALALTPVLLALAPAVLALALGRVPPPSRHRATSPPARAGPCRRALARRPVPRRAPSCRPAASRRRRPGSAVAATGRR